MCCLIDSPDRHMMCARFPLATIRIKSEAERIPKMRRQITFPTEKLDEFAFRPVLAQPLLSRIMTVSALCCQHFSLPQR